MTPRFDEPLASKTTLGIGGQARVFFAAESDEEVVRATAYARAHELPLRVLGGGSNVLVPDEGVEAVVLHLENEAITFEEAEGGSVLVTASAGTRWDALVCAATERGLCGIENLAGIPGTVGGAAVQNIGAYGAAFSDTFASAEIYDAESDRMRRITAANAAFGYRASAFKAARSQIILRVSLRLQRAAALRLAYPDLMRRCEAGETLDTSDRVARAVRSIRAEKFPDLSTEGTAGSFFANPVLALPEAEALRARFPALPLFALPEEPEKVKVPLAWVLDHVLGLKGFACGGVRLYEKQPLVLVAARGASAKDVVALANEVETRVRDATGISVQREVETFC